MRTIPTLDSLILIITFGATLITAGALGLPAPATWALVAALAVGAGRLGAAGLRWTDLGWRRARPWWRSDSATPTSGPAPWRPR